MSESQAVIATAGSLLNCRKQVLSTVEYIPERISGLFVFHHGLGEHSGRYSEVFTHIAEAGVAVFSYDAHGHGKSEPKDKRNRAFIGNFYDLVDDLMLFIENVKQKYPGLPLFIGGHSLGGLVAAHTLLIRQDIFSGLILHSACIDVEWTPILRFQAKIGNCLAACFPYAQLVPAVRPEDMSQDPKVVAQYRSDPLIYVGNTKANTANEILKAFRAVVRQQSQIHVPVYAAHGNCDRTTSLEAVKTLLTVAEAKDKYLYEVTGGYHEILFGPEKEECIADLIAWLQRQVAAPAPGGSTSKAEAAAAKPILSSYTPDNAAVGHGAVAQAAAPATAAAAAAAAAPGNQFAGVQAVVGEVQLPAMKPAAAGATAAAAPAAASPEVEPVPAAAAAAALGKQLGAEHTVEAPGSALR